MSEVLVRGNKLTGEGLKYKNSAADWEWEMHSHVFALFIVGVSSLAGVADVLKESCNFGVPSSSYSGSFLQLYLPAVIKVVTTNR